MELNNQRFQALALLDEELENKSEAVENKSHDYLVAGSPILLDSLQVLNGGRRDYSMNQYLFLAICLSILITCAIEGVIWASVSILSIQYAEITKAHFEAQNMKAKGDAAQGAINGILDNLSRARDNEMRAFMSNMFSKIRTTTESSIHSLHNLFKSKK